MRRIKANNTTKKTVLRSIKELPEDMKIEDAMERLYLLYKIDKGIKQSEEGNVLSHAEAKQRLKKLISLLSIIPPGFWILRT